MDKSAETYRFFYGEQIELVNYVWYIEGTTENMLVDAGGDSAISQKLGRYPKDIQPLDSSLKSFGISFEEIDLIILTHLHYDHVAQASRFPNAKFVVQAEELAFAQNPHPIFSMGYIKELFEDLKFEIVDGDAQICEGISVIKTPGHTPGGQSVSITTDQGISIIPGLCTVRENFEPPEPICKTQPVIIPGLHTNVFEAYENMVKLKEAADILLPCHDPEFSK